MASKNILPEDKDFDYDDEEVASLLKENDAVALANGETPATSTDSDNQEYFEASSEEDSQFPRKLRPKAKEVMDDEAYYGEDEQDLTWDEIIAQEDTMAAFKQEENVVSLAVEGLYDEKGKVLPPRELKVNPPLFVIASSDGQRGEFLVTKELSATLQSYFSDVVKAYNHMDPKAPKFFSGNSTREKLNGTLDWAKANPLKVAGVFIFFILVIVTLFFR